MTQEKYNEVLREAIQDTEGLPMCDIDWKRKDAMLTELSE